MTRARLILTFIVLGALAAVVAPAPASAATSRELLNCQKQFESQVRGYTNLLYLRVFGCAQKAVECKLADEIDAVDPTTCLARATKSCATAPAKVSDQLAVRKARVLKRCGLIALAELEQFLGGLGFFNVAATCSAASASDLVDCVFADAQCATERQLFRLDPRAQDSLGSVGIAASFPCVAP